MELNLAQGAIEVFEINWKAMSSLKCVKSGPSGVFIASFGQNEQAVVIKSCPQPVNTLFASFVHGQMKLFKVPHMRVLVHIDSEYKALQFAMDKVSLGNESLRAQVRGNINRPYILIMEYIPGFTMGQVLQERAGIFFHPDTMKGYTPKN